MRIKQNKAKLTIARSICGLFLATASTPSAFASDYTYMFTASPDQPAEFNGTTAEIEVTSEPYGAEANVFNWNFVDTALPAGAAPCSQIIPSTSGLMGNDISDANRLNWCGEFDGVSSSFNFYCENGGAADSAMVGDFVEGMPQIPSQCTYGSWAAVPDAGGSIELLVPDAGSSFELLATATAALGAGRFFFRRQKN